MTKSQKKIIRDMAAFLVYAEAKGLDFSNVMFTISHDIHGIMQKSKCFLPRTHGYSERIEKLAKAGATA